MSLPSKYYCACPLRLHYGFPQRTQNDTTLDMCWYINMGGAHVRDTLTKLVRDRWGPSHLSWGSLHFKLVRVDMKVRTPTHLS